MTRLPIILTSSNHRVVGKTSRRKKQIVQQRITEGRGREALAGDHRPQSNLKVRIIVVTLVGLSLDRGQRGVRGTAEEAGTTAIGESIAGIEESGIDAADATTPKAGSTIVALQLLRAHPALLLPRQEAVVASLQETDTVSLIEITEKI